MNMGTPTEPKFDDVEQRSRRVALKFRDGIGLPYEDGAEKYFSDAVGILWNELAEQFPGITLKRVFVTVSTEKLLELVAYAQKRNSKYNPPDFLTFFVIDLESLDLAEKLVMVLTESKDTWSKIVDNAYVESIPSLPVDLSQDYIYAPALLPRDIGGINAKYAWDKGEMGAGIQYVDIEQGWYVNHPDLLVNGGSKVIVTPENSISYGYDPIARKYPGIQHGTSVLGILSAEKNQTNHPDWNGIAMKAAGIVISPWVDPNWQPSNPPAKPADYKVADAIAAAATYLYDSPSQGLGDVILLEVQHEQKVKKIENGREKEVSYFWPIECEPRSLGATDIFQTILLATNAGIVVVEPAANGGPQGGENLNTKIIQDSQAIIVGAATPIDLSNSSNVSQVILKGSKTPSSNYGVRVNCFAWGSSVYSLNVKYETGVPTSPVDSYRGNFGGTSAAAAIVAGAAILVQGLAKKNGWGSNSNGTYTPQELRNVLSKHNLGTESNNPGVDLIGVMPDLKKIIDSKNQPLPPKRCFLMAAFSGLLQRMKR
jgi:hypothetical protein